MTTLKPNEFLVSASRCPSDLRSFAERSPEQHDLDLEEYFAWRDATVAEFGSTARFTTDSAAGVISLLEELLVAFSSEMDFSNLATWNPETIRPRSERDAERQKALD